MRSPVVSNLVVLTDHRTVAPHVGDATLKTGKSTTPRDSGKLEQPVGRDLYLRWYEKLQGSKLNPQIHELAPDTKLGTFPGYQNLRVRHKDLQRIIANDESLYGLIASSGSRMNARSTD